MMSEADRIRLSWEFLNQILLRKCLNALEIVQSSGAKSDQSDKDEALIDFLQRHGCIIEFQALHSKSRAIFKHQ